MGDSGAQYAVAVNFRRDLDLGASRLGQRSAWATGEGVAADHLARRDLYLLSGLRVCACLFGPQSAHVEWCVWLDLLFADRFSRDSCDDRGDHADRDVLSFAGRPLHPGSTFRI